MSSGAPPVATSDPPSLPEQKQAADEGHVSANENTANAAIEVQKRYQAEREKRLQAEGNSQYIDINESGKFKEFVADPWLEESSNTNCLKDGDKIKCLVNGAGFGGLLLAINLVKEGLDAKDIRIIDSAGGFGGTWYWNRYPGLMCDVESYIYLPFLEEMNYIPKHRYSYGPEIRQYANDIASNWDLSNKAMFRTKTESMQWDEDAKEWVVKLTQQLPEGGSTILTVRSQFVLTASGVLLHPKLPGFLGLDRFQKHMFHTSRWDYKFTGGSPEDPAMVHLKDKRVGIIGTGATAVQAIPHLAKWSKHLTVFQRTPSGIDHRGQHETDPEWFKQNVATQKGWQLERQRNWNRVITDDRAVTDDLVKDGWSTIRGYRTVIGGPGRVSMEKIPEYVAGLHATDLPRQERVRARVDDVVKDKETAEKLKAWYASWCKRPCFHDDYLQTYNEPNVTLVDTNGKGVERLTENGVVVDGEEHEVDVLILSTGFRSPFIGGPAHRAGMTVTGRNGLSLDQKWIDGVSTLHGVVTHDFPNFFWPGPFQAGATGNFTFALSMLSRHVAHIIATAERREAGARVTIEPTAEAEQVWTMEVLQRAAGFAAMGGCTPGYFNLEGDTDKMPPEQQMKAAQASPWGEGIEDYMGIIERWRKDGRLEGLAVQVQG